MAHRTVIAGLALACWLAGRGQAEELQPADASQRSAEAAAGVLARSCLECHNGSRHESGLDLTRRQTALKGGDGGPAIVPGDLEHSLLWQRVARGEMPPAEHPPLADEDRHRLREWLMAGAAWAEDPIDRFRYTTESRAGSDWWSLQPVVRPDLPEIRDAAWPRNEIDRFVLAKLEERGLKPSPPADRRTLIRRLHFDLTGLPPGPDAVEAFVRNDDPHAYAQLVDELLESPHYGERWARHWLDVVGFGESEGFLRNWLRPDAWKYRDWVIQALNEDVPYREFVRMQIAGDVLDPENPLAIIATGCLVAGRYNQESEVMGSPEMQLEARHDELEGNVRNLGRVFLGLSIDCARCHDHKFDPISQQDYYRFAASIASYRHNRSLPRQVAGLPEDHAERQRLALAMRPVRERMAALDAEVRARLQEEAAAEHERQLAAARADAQNIQAELEAKVRQAGIRWIDTRSGLPVAKPTPSSPWRGLERAMLYAAAIGALLVSLALPAVRRQVRRVVRPSMAALGGVLILAAIGVQAAVVEKPPEKPKWLQQEPVETDEIVRLKRRFAYKRADVGRIESSVPAVSFGEVLEWLPPEQRPEYAELVRSFSELESRDRLLAGGDAYAVVPDEVTEPMRIYERGDAAQPGEIVAPGGLACVSLASTEFGLSPDAPDAERRARLADWIADPAHPLTWRVVVNRVWHHHFGTGIVATPNDFGFNGDSPSHPELLDWLAAEFLAREGRLKELHRLIVTSATYRQASRGGGEASRIDPHDRWLSRWPLRRLEGEAIRDAMLAVAGELDPTMGGPGYRDFRWSAHLLPDLVEDSFEPIEVFGGAYDRRTIYRTWIRSTEAPLLDALDCPESSFSTPARPTTTTPLQALSLLNNHFPATAAKRFAARLVREAGDRPEDQVRRAYRLAFSRQPAPDELGSATAFAARHGLEQLCLVLFNSSEFLYVN